MSALIARPEQLLDRGLTAEEVFNTAGVSNATFYRRFSDKNTYVQALIERLADAPDSAEAPRLRARARAAGAQGGPTATQLRDLIVAFFPVLTEPRTVSRRVLAHTFADSTPRAARSVRADYARRDARILALYDEVLAENGLTLRRPFTPRMLAVVITALFEGFQLRHRSDPGSVTPHVLADSLLAVLGGALDTDGRHEHLDDLPLVRESTPRVTELPRDPRAAVLAVAREEFAKRGYFMARLENIAAGSGVPIEQLRKLFPTKAHLIIGALRPRFEVIQQAIDDDLVLELDETVIIEHYLLHLAEVCTEDMPFTDALMLALAHDTYGEPDRVKPLKEELNLPAMIAPIIEAGRRNGVFTGTADPVEVGAELTNALFLRCFTRRENTAEENARIVGDLVLRGLIRR
ncbi:TetR/AcrR family transcriptional regulator [Nocardia higoensis]|uniref:TetR/AcrR family transcriptional regulator n=1 Tax=Nocardia higoensis TaxID=228599 RepID=A0ABS0D8K6_9NOCA|nr:TetR/AcrR family transcriptional regulator [Nocardia higoensis]MBF6353189.1 TetR/AcrR family transcriptional regulator [Nocardia higoensis]